MEDFSNRSVCHVHYGLFQPLSHRLARDFGKVYDYQHQRRGHPLVSDVEPGQGYDDIESIDSWLDIIPKVDLFVFSDLYDADIQEHLLSLGKRVFGVRRGDEMEIYRSDFRRLMKRIGLKLPTYEEVTGFDALRSRLQEVEDKFIKTSADIRGTIETWKHMNYFLSSAYLDHLSESLGSRKKSQEFIIEEPIKDVVEVGYDDICILGKFASQALIGVEEKDRAYFGCFLPYNDIPEVLREVNGKLAETFKQYDYRGFWSEEIRGDILIDATARHPSPAGECEHEIWKNLSERLWYGADGQMVDPEPAAKYAAQAIISSGEVEDAPLPIEVDPKVRPWVKLFHSAMDEDRREYVHPVASRMSEIGSVVGIGDTADEAQQACIDHAAGVRAMKLEIFTEELEKAKESLFDVI